MRVTIRQEHIDQAREYQLNNESSGANCPIALALNEQLGVSDQAYFGAWVSSVGIAQTYLPARAQYTSSGPAKRFIYKFDAGQLVKPAVFILQRVG